MNTNLPPLTRHHQADQQLENYLTTVKVRRMEDESHDFFKARRARRCHLWGVMGVHLKMYNPVPWAMKFVLFVL